MDTLVKTVFEALGVKPNEKFKIKQDIKGIDGDLYYLDENLCGYCVEKEDSFIPFNANFLQDILRGKIEIVKIKEPTKEDKIIIGYARLFGYNWIAVDGDGEIVVSKSKLQRCDLTDCWETTTNESEEYILGKLSFLTWEDEPYYIGGEE